MSRDGYKVFYLLLCFCLTTDADIELSPKLVYDLLSSRIDDVVYDTKNLKLELAETKAIVAEIEKKIEQISANVSLITIKEDSLEEINSKSLSIENDQSIPNFSESVILRKMLVSEKFHMRNTVKNFERKMKAFEADINNRLSFTRMLVESAIDTCNNSIIDHNTAINISIMSIDNKVVNTVKVIDKNIKRVNASFESAVDDLEAKVSQRISNTESNLQTTIRELDNRLNGAERKVRSLSARQEREDGIISDKISALSDRLTAEEARKVAFSAKLHKKNFNSKLIYDQVLYSYGGGYSSSTGIFTAPKAGTYIFTFNVQPLFGKKAQFAFNHNGKFLTTAIVESDNENVSGGNVGISYVNKGEKVWIEAILDDKYHIWLYKTTFNGILID